MGCDKENKNVIHSHDYKKIEKVDVLYCGEKKFKMT